MILGPQLYYYLENFTTEVFKGALTTVRNKTNKHNTTQIPKINYIKIEPDDGISIIYFDDNSVYVLSGGKGCITMQKSHTAKF